MPASSRRSVRRAERIGFAAASSMGLPSVSSYTRASNRPLATFPIFSVCFRRGLQHGFKVSMSGTGKCYDNAAVLRRENSAPRCFLILLTFFKTIKAALLWQRSWPTRRAAERAIFQYINRFYNPRRRHSALGCKSSGLSNGKWPKRPPWAALNRDRSTMR